MPTSVRIVSVVAMLAGVAVAAATPVDTLAQATPVSSGCSVAPLPVAEVVTVIGTPVVTETATPATPAAVDEEGPSGTPRLIRPELPPGEPADSATVAAITETARQFVACGNNGDVLAMMALVSRDFLRQSFAGVALSADAVATYAGSPQPRPAEQQQTVVAVREARRLADGRVGALVDTVTGPVAHPRDAGTDFVVFVQEGDRYLIDRYVAGVEVWFGPEVATPVT